MSDNIRYSTYPEGKCDWYYRLFSRFFSKLYIDKYDNQYYHKIFWFKYTTDGKKCMGLYPDPNDDYPPPPEAEEYEPDCLFFCAITLRFIRRRILHYGD